MLSKMETRSASLVESRFFIITSVCFAAASRLCSIVLAAFANTSDAVAILFTASAKFGLTGLSLGAMRQCLLPVRNDVWVVQFCNLLLNNDFVSLIKLFLSLLKEPLLNFRDHSTVWELRLHAILDVLRVGHQDLPQNFSEFLTPTHDDVAKHDLNVTNLAFIRGVWNEALVRLQCTHVDTVNPCDGAGEKFHLHTLDPQISFEFLNRLYGQHFFCRWDIRNLDA